MLKEVVKDAELAKSADQAGGEEVKETEVEGVVHTDSSATDLDIDVTQMAPTHYVSGKFKLKGPFKKKKGSDEDDAPYVPTEAEARKVKRGRGIKRSAKPIGGTPRKSKVRKIVIKPLKGKADDSSKAPEKVIEEVPIIEAQVHVPSPPRSPIHESIPIQTEVYSSPPQQSILVEEPGSTSKKAATPISSQSFLGVPHNHGPAPSLDNVGFFGDERVDGILKRVSILEKAKDESDEKLKETEAELKETKEKLKSVEAENVVLKNELTMMNEKVLDDEARINVLNEMFDEILSSNSDLNGANATMSHASEIMKIGIEDLKVRDENKSKQIEMLYAVIEDRLGINVHAAFDDIGIRRAEARRMERQRLEKEEAARSALDKGKNIAEEEVLESSVQQEQKQPEVEVMLKTLKLMC
ncbi:hypothetical protein HanLR1_Chr01g0006091 [Helianthus annuus]|nr:hypothetical protein HanHA89_Chr01g0006911 [Helianthus annuus]KAJ0782264.1 hypothetical protein HanLR1_Chr01g0006091 [Helianthus annuus]